ncbi:MraY family glycosyltransferase [uncultured Microscilla sp.]|uniref:MraY family glycosyltransferase n=1 Tax=uncultured Microscilla sp. TaxID=432653 RepID=UPI0026200924|nr:MraY family glycosyltransferase [uncultured Microscilla sp.]
MTLFLTFVTSLIITYLSIPSIIKVADEKHLYDLPNEIKTSHSTGIPTLGGIAIFGGTLITSTFFIEFDTIPRFNYILCAMTLLFFTGVKDDVIPLTPSKKFIAQVISASIIVFKANIRLTSLYGLFGIQALPYWISIGISLFTIIVIINAFNLIDGINGLTGGVGIIVSLTFAFFFYQIQEIGWVIFILALCGSLMAFLKFNFANKIFMGDTGSLLVGCISVVLCISFIEHPEVQKKYSNSFTPVFAFCILIIPLFDTLRVFTIRIFNKKSPFQGDRKHLHHILVDGGLAHWQASFIMYLANLSIILLAYSLKHISALFLLFGVLALCTVSSFLLVYFHKPKSSINKPQAIKQ